ncbi:hypothetical protein AC1031_004166 [Aphanomyces cochlioides]|nr:hypothetical protein AC1031_004166 [Aphanomyces cochlioides]
MAKEKWSDNETHDLISYWEDHFEDYRRHKTPFYEAAAKAVVTKGAKSYELDNILGSSVQIRTQALVDTTQRISAVNTNQQESTPQADGHEILPDLVAVHEQGQTHSFDNTPVLQ